MSRGAAGTHSQCRSTPCSRGGSDSRWVAVNRRRVLGTVGTAAFAPGCLRLQSQADSETTQPGDGDSVVSAAETESGAREWRAQRFDAANSGYSANGDAPREVPSVLGELDQSVGQAVDPLFSGDPAYFLTDDGTVLAVDAASGERQWETHSVGAPRVPEAVVDDSVVAARSLDGRVFGVSRSDGSLGDPFSFGAAGFGLTPAGGPTAVGDTVYVGSDDSTLYALDAESGDLRWRFETQEAVRPVAAGGNRVYAGTTTAMYVLGFE